LLRDDLVYLQVLLPYSSDGLIGLLHRRGVVESEDYGREGVTIEAKVPQMLAYHFEPYLVTSQDRSESTGLGRS
jgi:GTP-binding protein HflX